MNQEDINASIHESSASMRSKALQGLRQETDGMRSINEIVRLSGKKVLSCSAVVLFDKVTSTA